MGDADLIVALAGRQSRKTYALRLFSRGHTSQLLLSVGRFELRRFSELPSAIPVDLPILAATIPPPKRHFFVSAGAGTNEVELVKRGRLGTESEILALANWLVARPNLSSLLIITSGCHVRRVRLCCRILLPKTVRFGLLAVKPEDDPDLQRDSWWRERRTRAIVLLELPKLLLYWPLLRLKRSAGFLPASHRRPCQSPHRTRN